MQRMALKKQDIYSVAAKKREKISVGSATVLRSPPYSTHDTTERTHRKWLMELM